MSSPFSDSPDPNLTDNTRVVANLLNYDDDLAILQQGSIPSIKRRFQQIENPDSLPENQIRKLPADNTAKALALNSAAISINSRTFVVKFVVVVLLIYILFNYVNK